jgi:hypothetical protein
MKIEGRNKRKKNKPISIMNGFACEKWIQNILNMSENPLSRSQFQMKTHVFSCISNYFRIRQKYKNIFGVMMAMFLNALDILICLILD